MIRPHDGPIALTAVGVSFDFGNTLVRVDRASLRSVVAATSADLAARGAIRDEAAFRTAWAAERDRQFRLQVPQLLEVDLAERVRHALAELRGVPAPATDADPWDEPAVDRVVTGAEVDATVETYSQAFVARMSPDPAAEGVLRTLHERGFRLAISSNWPLARTIDRYVEARGWRAMLAAVVVSQRVGVIKPHPRLYETTAAALRARPDQLVHVGDDWAADIVGAAGAGWRTIYLRGHQDDTPLPTSERDSTVSADIELGRLEEVPARLRLEPATGASGAAADAP